MALFTDGIISAMEDLAAQDSSILEISSAEGIDLTRKLELAQQEVGIDLEAALRRVEGVMDRGIGLSNVVVSAPLKLWHTFRSLELAYRDAYHNQLNDRYRGRRDEYRDLARWAAEKVMQAGIGVNENPIPRAAAPKLRVAGGGMQPGTYFFAMSWTNGCGEEGAASDAVSFDLATAGGIVVQAGSAPPGAGGWNVYAGSSEDGLRRQNSRVLSPGEEWAQGTEPSDNGSGPGSGQDATSYRQAPRVIQRG